MEIRKDLQLNYKLSITDNYLDYFSKALEFVNQNYKEDFDRIANTDFNTLTPGYFLREAHWCQLTSGFNAKIVSQFFPKLCEVYGPLHEAFVHNKQDLNISAIKTAALTIFNNKRKVQAAIDIAINGGKEINRSGWLIYKNEKLSSPEKLQALPFIGKITCFHLARNCGLLDFIKPDIHLVRAASAWGFDNPLDMCKNIQKVYDIPSGLIDLVLWYALSTFGSK